MPSMFSRRRASSQPPQHTAPPSSSAAIAASAAFLSKSTSTASLSSAAAAAALRSQTVSPEPIGSIQTKRMARRGSQSSLAGASVMGTPTRNGPGRGMVRQSSNSSMTERSFRSPSPGGRGGAMSPAYNAPPVPSIPKTIPRGQRRSASLDVPTRIASPTPRAGARNGSVNDFGPVDNNRAGLPRLPELVREDSNQSVNFSRPWSPTQAPAPPPQRPHSSVGWSSPHAVGSGTSRGTAPARPQSSMGFSSPGGQQKAPKAGEQTTPKKKKKKNAVDEGARPVNGIGPPGAAVVPDTARPAAQGAAPTAHTIATGANGTTPAKRNKNTVALPLDTQVPGSSSAGPAKLSPGSDAARSPVSPRATTPLHKQPSVVREDPEAEASAEVESLPTKGALSKSMSLKGPSRTVNTSEGPAQMYVAPGGAPRNRAVSLDIPRATDHRRSSESLSPSGKARAHFVEGSLIATPANVKHQPPPRSVSPYKSALKHSPSSSLRTSSPNFGSANGSRAAPSDASDTTSLASQDGVKPVKKRKSARVSFDDGPNPVAPVPEAVSATRDVSAAYSGDENFDELMKPRPALPSFGSVRGRKPSVQSDVPEKVTETVPSMSDDLSTPPEHHELSGDNFIGAVLANHHAQKSGASSTVPLPPAETSVEGTAYDLDSSYSEHDPGKREESHSSLGQVPADGNLAAEESEGEVPESSDEHNIAIPDISVQPATPGIEEEPQPSMHVPAEKRFSMPGGWDDVEEAGAGQSHRKEVHEEAQGLETESDDDDPLQPLPVVTERHSPLLHPIYESDPDSDDSEAFSDAAEDPSEFEGGFASLDAMVGSPASPRSPGVAVPASPDETPTQLTTLPQPTLQSSPPSAEPIAGESGDWGQATAYWSSLSRTKKLQIERESRVEDAPQPVAPAPKPKKKKIVQSAPMVITDPSFYAPPENAESPTTTKVPQAQPDSRGPALRKSMRDTADPARANTEIHVRKSMRGSAEPATASNETHMRKSMRSGTPTGGSMRSSMRGNDPGQRKSAPPSPSVKVTGAASSLPASVGAAASAQSQASKKPFVAPLPAYDSDSDSSFKKKRRGSVSTVDSVGHYTMRRSMRSGSVDAGSRQPPTSPPTATRGSGRLSLRSLSPTGSFANRNRGQEIRTSLRGPPANDAPTMRGKNSRAARDAKSPSRFSMSGFSKPKPSAPPASSVKSRFSSRFADSDDENDAAPASRGGFRSRFADSDDEDSPVGPPKHVPADLAPVRGIPKRRDEDSDSTDLDDSDDERRGRVSQKPGVSSQSDIDAAMAAARRNVAAMNGGREPGVAETRPETADLSQTATVSSDAPATPTRRRGFMGSIMSRRRSSSVQPGSPMSVQSQPAATRPPKLQRRTTPQNWPLSAPSQVNGHGDRPTTTDGTGETSLKRTMRPDLGRRSMSGNDLKTIADGGTYSERTGKKKFSRLRRVFGLND